MELHHIAIWTFQLEKLREFYTRYFHGTSNNKYVNPTKGFESYFISFQSGPSLELMSRKDIKDIPFDDSRLGLTHIAFTFPSKEEVLRFTEKMRAAGYTIAGEPRTSGDGYFESVVLDPDDNRIECVFNGNKVQETSKTAPRLETERLLLRPFEESDAEAIFESCKNPKLGSNAGWAPHQNIEETRTVLHTVFMGQESVWAITLKENNQLIGSIGMIPDPKRENPQSRMIGYWLDESQWGKGYMTEATETVINYGFQEMRLSIITATCYGHNKRSKSVIEGQGFIYEGIIHQAEKTYDGHVYDYLSYYLPNISKPIEQEYDELLEIWEKAVRDSHHFLTEEDIQFYKPLVRDHYLKAVDLFIVRNEYGKIAGFMGLSDELIEMLFIHPDEKGKGYGKQLVNHAINKKHIYKVDVNEGNKQALAFYQHVGYKVIGRDDTDSMGKPFPILHLQIDKK